MSKANKHRGRCRTHGRGHKAGRGAGKRGGRGRAWNEQAPRYDSYQIYARTLGHARFQSKPRIENCLCYLQCW